MESTLRHNSTNCSLPDYLRLSDLMAGQPCSAGGGGEVEGHALVSAGPEGPEGHQPGVPAHAHRSRRSQSM